jgi:Na+-transporting methylmalonyl-CoA/oxaloacetate decarboxylase gamma subunit
VVGVSNSSPRRLPEEIYVRRRVAAAVVILVLVALLVWGLVAFANRGSDEPAPTSPTGTTTAAAAAATETTEVTETSSTTETTSEAEEAESPRASESAEPRAEGRDTCELSDLRIVASSDRPSYGADVQPTFYMTVTNPTEADCEINLDEDELRFEVYDLESNARVWADTDCFPSILTGEEAFPAGDERRFQAVWSRLGSQPGQCSNRQNVGAGAFFLHAVIGDNPSDAHTFNLG